MTHKNPSLSSMMVILTSVALTFLLGACTKTYNYHDYASKEAFFNHPIDPYKWDYLLTGEPKPDPICGSLTIVTSPQKAEISLDGEDTGEDTPAEITDVMEGKHVVAVRYGRTRVKCTFYQTESESHHLTVIFNGDRPPSIAFQ